jgi:RES domain-containing protein
MKLYRIAPKKYATDLSGEGARLAGGRWNPRGTPVVYTAEQAALALLETIPSFDLSSSLPPDIQLVTIEIPDGVSTLDLYEKELPIDWKDFPYKLSTVRIGQKWILDGKAAVLKVPSVMVPYGLGWNLLLNPLHPELHSRMSTTLQDWELDKRIVVKLN